MSAAQDKIDEAIRQGVQQLLAEAMEKLKEVQRLVDEHQRLFLEDGWRVSPSAPLPQFLGHKFVPMLGLVTRDSGTPEVSSEWNHSDCVIGAYDAFWDPS